jgi:hypothetical protein
MALPSAAIKKLVHQTTDTLMRPATAKFMPVLERLLFSKRWAAIAADMRVCTVAGSGISGSAGVLILWHFLDRQVLRAKSLPVVVGNQISVTPNLVASTVSVKIWRIHVPST